MANQNKKEIKKRIRVRNIEKDKEYRIIHKEEIALKNKIRNQLPENKEKRKKYLKDNEKERKEKTKIWQNSPKGKFSAYRNSAKGRNIPWELTFEQFMIFWHKSCYYCGDKIDTIGIDRIDNSKGYTMDNCVSCCEFCNIGKLKMSNKEFIQLCIKIAKRLEHEVIEYAI